MEKYNEIAGIIPETELDDMCSDETVGGTSTWPCAITTTIVAVTFKWDYCPTQACTDSCRFHH